MAYLLTSATIEELKTILLQAGLEVLAEGDPDEFAAFLNSEKRQELDHVAFIWFSGSLRGLEEMRDRPVFAVEGVPTPITADARLMDTLKEIVAEGVKRHGFFVVDLMEFGLSVETAGAVAAAAGVEVSAGMKAVFAVADAVPAAKA